MTSTYMGIVKSVRQKNPAKMRLSVIKKLNKINWLSAISFACAIHCIATPFALLFVPFIGHYFENMWVEITILSISILSGTWVISKGYYAHKKIQSVCSFAFGAFLWILHFWVEHNGFAGAKLYLVAGTLFILIAFFLNHKYLTQEKDSSKKCCSHLHH